MKKVFRIFSVLTAIIMFASAPVCAQDSSQKKKVKTDSIPLKGYVYDRLTTRELPFTLIQVLRPDSSLISTAKGGRRYWTWNNGSVREDSTSSYEIYIPRVKGDYLIKVSKEGYNDLYTPYTVEFGSRTSELKAPKLYMSRHVVKELDEVTVKVSKIKVYHKGDTLVYNADAFNLPEGSMLDALVQQMPGVEIKGNKIYVNGKFVESLLLNGKEFFKGDQSVAMQNIGAYAVKDVAVYEKNEESAELLGDRDDIQKEYVMDVRLKKDYMAGMTVNAEAGYGTRGRYLGRLFALGYTNNMRLSLYGNANNMNVSNRLDENGEQYSTTRDSGITTRANGGIDYNIDNAMHTWEVNGNADVHYTDAKDRITTNAVQYLQNTDNYMFSDKNSRLHNLVVSTNHQIKLNREQWNLRITPSFEYNKQKDHTDTRSATFDKEFDELNPELINKLYTPDYTSFTQALINRNLELYNSNSHGYNGELALASKIKIPKSPDAMEFKGNIRYRRNSQWGSTLQDIAFGDLLGDGLAPVSSLLQQRDQAVRPDYTFRLLGLARYYFTLPFGSLNASYEYIHTQDRKNSSLLLMESMAHGTMAEFTPGQIPVPDLANSYTGKKYKNQHHLKLIWRVKKKFDRGTLEVGVEPSVFLERHDLFYTQGDASVNPRETFWRFEVEKTYLSWATHNNKIRLGLYYDLTQQTPDLLKMVDIPNTTDPMNIWLGNPDLKKSTDHRLTFSMYGQHSRHTRQNIYANVYVSTNSFANGYVYESATGIRRMKTYNVNGTNSFSLSHWINQDLDKSGRWRINNSIYGVMSNYVNMIGYDAQPESQKVKSWGIYEHLSLSYETKLLTLRAMGMLYWNKAKNSGNSIVNGAYGNCGPGLEATLSLPFRLEINGSYYTVKYFGYNDSAMNRWEGQLRGTITYTMLDNRLTFKLSGRDLLNQQTGLRMSVNATGRTQSQELTLGRTILFTVGYKFNVKPKRR